MTENTSQPTSPISQARVHVYPSVVELDAASLQHQHRVHHRADDLERPSQVTVGVGDPVQHVGRDGQLLPELEAVALDGPTALERDLGDDIHGDSSTSSLGLDPQAHDTTVEAGSGAGALTPTPAPGLDIDLVNRERHLRDPWWMRCGWCGQWGDFNPDSTQLHPEHLGEQKTADYGRGPTLITRTILGDVYTRGDLVEIGDSGRLTRDQAHQLLTHLHTALGL